MKFPTASAPHTVAPHVAPKGVARVMRLVIYALLPATALHVVVFGPGILVQMTLGIATALATEAVALRLRRQPLRPFLTDGSAIITAMLIALCLPPLAPWWLIASGTAFAIVIAKHLYGGLGSNPFNPAMVGYAVLLVSFPTHLSRWLAPDVAGLQTIDIPFMDTLHAILMGHLPDALRWDAITSPTPLGAIKLASGRTLEEAVASPIFGPFGGRGWDWINFGIAAGGVWLLALRIIRWHTPVAMLTGLMLPAAFMYAIDPGTYPGPLFHLTAGATLLGAFFIATDPTSSATSDQGKLVYGAGIGLVTYVIRTWGSHADGVAFAVLLMNLAVPLIDRYTIPRIYGHER
ncbi:MAG TPA: RnfABCDGE type electron transport complex subunit D [Povalibacter sp.]|uniref:RnfABCDGE type electron transport complex subunit D n=1 Tax=Povalibacter sp. TaxID=1962978 RepID=UPI002BBE93D7|nr:RnfABCDGE type electron transport complex subunit D [Povalibacter sp.]HMN43482.1 RnfABCDGE type electron transport complex subunit D [Povalibacter sp.]